MIRGDTYVYTFKLKKKGVTPTEYVDGSIYTEIELQFNYDKTFNSVKKLKSRNEVGWDSTNSRFECSLSQEDTFKLSTGENKVQVRLYVNGVCKGSNIHIMNVGAVQSSEVLK